MMDSVEAWEHSSKREFLALFCFECVFVVPNVFKFIISMEDGEKIP